VSDRLSPVHCINSNLHQVARAVSRVYAQEMRSSGLTRTQFGIMSCLTMAGTLRLSDLADKLVLERTSLTRILKPLENQGLILIRTSDDDARTREISLTDKGRKKYHVANKLWQKSQRKLLKSFGEKNWHELERSLLTLRNLVS